MTTPHQLAFSEATPTLQEVQAAAYDVLNAYGHDGLHTDAELAFFSLAIAVTRLKWNQR
jgi:hypothetical protein